MMQLRRSFLALIFVCGTIPSSSITVLACATLGGPEMKIVPVLQERVLIAWDASSSTEHFIRRISFDAAQHDLGFLVPLPSVPDISEADSSVFDRLEKKIEPTELTIPRPISIIAWLLDRAMARISQMLTGAASVMGAPDGSHFVRVISTTQLPGQTAVVLEANDAQALSSWLQTNGFVTRPDLAPWLQKYILAHWKLVAFKFDPHSTVPQQFSTAAVSLSFKTDQPFFPYREPSDEWSKDATTGRARLLKIFFVGAHPVVGSLGAERTQWPGRTVYSFPLLSTANMLLGATQAMTFGRFTWLTVFEDRSSPRPAAEDLYFDIRRSLLPIIPAPKIIWFPIPIPIELILIAAFLYLTRQRKTPK